MVQRPTQTPFHLAIPVRDLDESRAFYGEVLGCREGRSDRSWVDFDLFGHQVVCHVVATAGTTSDNNPVDGDDVPIPHFGVVLSMERWHALARRLEGIPVEFAIAPKTRFRGEPGEQGTFFLRDPSGNALEFKGFRNLDDLFATRAP